MVSRTASEGTAVVRKLSKGQRSIELAGVRIDCVTEAQVVTRVISDMGMGRGGWIVTLNVDVLRILSERADLRKLLSQADLMAADGVPLLWASRIRGTSLPDRVAGTSLILSLSAAAARAGATIFLLGGSPAAAEGTAAVLRRDYAGLQIAGIACPPLGFDQEPIAIEELGTTLLRAHPDIVYVCLGFPKQECVIQELRATLPSTWFLGLGGSFTIISGQVNRAPVWMQKMGLEWIWRLGSEPRRLFQRYIVHDVPFAIRLLASALRHRIMTRGQTRDQKF
jgi:N-acetylglucosaminyldiphosphoundecaprenol N-acetyl-beta-D-mannosaminyltransferase